ncbi:MAG: hypothetical protein OES84_01205 [Kiritimatiellaceae bacterium]|nr:hypothetical protein [Kiritimatiellaceae bacterium]
MIMMEAHPATDGYPRVGFVVENDLSTQAQLHLGERLRVAEVT